VELERAMNIAGKILGKRRRNRGMRRRQKKGEQRCECDQSI
jgi:hypothetical protein